MEIGICDKCKKKELLSQYRFWFLCWGCTEEVMDLEEKRNKTAKELY